MTLTKRDTPIKIRLLLSISMIILCLNLSFGRNDDNIHKSTDLTIIHHIEPSNFSVPLFFSLNKIEYNAIGNAIIMEDTVCISNSTDTFFVNSATDVIAYNWSVPTGAVISSTFGDTMIVVNWTNATLGLSNICVESVNNCGISAPTCMPIRVITCNESPNAVDDRDTIPSNTAVVVEVQLNDSDPENHDLITNLDATNGPSNGKIHLLLQ